MRKNSVYSREWDREYRGYFSHECEGIHIGGSMLKRALDRANIPQDEKEKILRIIEQLEAVSVDNSISRLSVSKKTARSPPVLTGGGIASKP